MSKISIPVYQVCKQLLKDNITPVWSTGVDNYASQAIAQKLYLYIFDTLYLKSV